MTYEKGVAGSSYKQSLTKQLELLKDSPMLEENRTLIGYFIEEYCHGQDPQTVGKYIIRLRWIAEELNKCFLDADRSDILRLDKLVETRPAMMYDRKGKKWKEMKVRIFDSKERKEKLVPKKTKISTQEQTKQIIRTLWKWIEFSYKKANKPEDRLRGKKLRQVLARKNAPELVEDVICAERNDFKLTYADMYTQEETIKVSQQASHIRTKSLIQLIGEVGLRKGEVIGERPLQIGDMDFRSEDGRIIGTVHIRSSKTEKHAGIRECEFTWAAPAILDWLKVHPFRGNKEAPLFCKFVNKEHHFIPDHPEPMTYSTMRKEFRNCVSKARIDKRSNPHHFRKSVATRLAAAGMSELQIKAYLGWTADSKVLKHYIFIGSADANRAYRKTQGFETESEKGSLREARPIKCRSCGHICAAGDIICGECGENLLGRTAEERKLDESIDRAVLFRLKELKLLPQNG